MRHFFPKNTTLGLLAAVLLVLAAAPARADFSTAPCNKLTDPKQKELCQKKELEKLGPMYFSVYEPSGKRHRVRLENSGNPCKDIPKDGEFHIYRDRREMRKRTPYRKIRCKGGKIVSSESGLPPPTVEIAPPAN